MPQSALMSGSVGAVFTPADFPTENLTIDPQRYTYEGRWLFCSFENPAIRAVRIGFGQGAFRWDDYGLPAPPSDRVPLSYRVELITDAGVEACLFSRTFEQHPIDLECGRLSFRDVGRELFGIDGWPRMQWRFQSVEGSIAADFEVIPHRLVVWPDCVMPHNTLSMSIGACEVRGTVRTASGTAAVAGGGFFDHPRVRVEDNMVPPFGWYIYAPLRFRDGSMLVSYYLEDGNGKIVEEYSAGFLTEPNGSSRWLTQVRCCDIQLGPDGNPKAWETMLEGPHITMNYRVQIADVPLLKLWGAEPSPNGKYVAFPLLMSAEGDCVIDGIRSELSGGSGIAEHLVRQE